MTHPGNKLALKDLLRRWQEVELDAIRSAAEILERTQNPIVQLVMDVMQNDSERHHWVLQMLIDGIEHGSFGLTRQEMEEVAEPIERHARIEEGMVSAVRDALGLSEEMDSPFKAMLEYLLDDEQKHAAMLERLKKTSLG